MAIDATEKRRQMARNFITQSDLLMRAVYGLDTLATEFSSSGLTFQDSDFEGQPGLSHIDAAGMNNVLSNAPALRQHLETNFIDDVFNAARSS